MRLPILAKKEQKTALLGSAVCVYLMLEDERETKDSVLAALCAEGKKNLGR